MESVRLKHTSALYKKSFHLSTDSSEGTNISQSALRLSNDDISRCFTAESSLNLTAEREIAISYHIQHQHPPASRGGDEVTKSNATQTTHVPGSGRRSPQSQHKADVVRKPSRESATGICSIAITAAAPGEALSILFLNQTCSRYNHVRVQDSHDGWSSTLDGCSPWRSPGYDVTTANGSAVLVIHVHSQVALFRLKVHIKAVTVRMTDGFITRYVSRALGYIQTPGWHPFNRPFTGFTDGIAAVTVPSGHVTVISAVHIHVSCYNEASMALVSVSEDGGGAHTEWEWHCYNEFRPGAVLLTDFTQFRVKFHKIPGYFFFGVRVLFSFHKPSLAPQQRPDDLWNCSVSSWPDFRLHFVCNNKTECAGQKDELRCPGGILLNDRCYIFISLPDQKNSWHHARTACLQRGVALASFPTANDWYSFGLLTQAKGHDDGIWSGLRSSDVSYPHMYGTTKDIQSNRRHVSRDIPVPSISCPNQHWTHDFLACDDFSACHHGYDAKSDDANVTTDNAITQFCVAADRTSFKALFPCQNGGRSVPYSLVCNHLQDCADNSDEGFCVFPACSDATQFKCANGQCLQSHQHCDDFAQCVDETDEQDCWFDSSRCVNSAIVLQPPPAVTNFDGRGWMISTPLTAGGDMRADLCPDTHVFCPSEGYCLPVYVRCNGLYDCRGYEDEVDCDSYKCPGLYRCRGSRSTCLHPDHLCDSIPQCPQHDDELFCNLTCPVNCTCLGHAFTCTNDFHAESYFRLRYLDVGGTGFKPGRLANNSMLVYLSLANCGLAHLENLTLPNLIGLDLSDNRFSVVTVAELNLMKNLQNLSLARNPISALFSGNYSPSSLEHENILHIDLTGARLKVLDMPSYLPFPSLLSLNMSESGVTRLIGDGFRSLPSLRTLDLRGCPMTLFPRRPFKDLKSLSLVFADNYKLCCEDNLPDGFDVMGRCEAPFSEISSCVALLRANIYRICMSVLAAMALSGNLGCFSLRMFSHAARGKGGFHVFVTHLCVSDFVMGAYMAMVGVADRLYLGRYLWEEDRWRQSAACQVAGVLALLSSEVSALIICLITLDRFLVIRFPFSRLRFSSFSAQCACLVTWTVGVVLVTVPLLPAIAYTHFYGQTGICVPLPINTNDFAGRHYAFGVMILFNLAVFIVIAAGQISVYLSMTSNAMSSVDVSRKSRDLIVARRLITVVVSDFLCWFPIGLLGLLAAQGVPISGEVNVALAVFVLPLNSALNPYLYTLNMIQEKRQRATEVKLLRLIMDHEINDNDVANKD